MTFGLSIVFMGNYITGEIVNNYIGDGYIGLLSSLTTLSAIILAAPMAYISNHYNHGKWAIMVIGGCCFVFEGLSVALLSKDQVGSWGFVVVIFLVHGAARGVFENTNKAVISEYFADPPTRSAAYAAVYFTSGLAAAIGFALYAYITITALIVIYMCMAIAAIVCYTISYQTHAINPDVGRSSDVSSAANSPSTTDDSASPDYNSIDRIRIRNKNKNKNCGVGSSDEDDSDTDMSEALV